MKLRRERSRTAAFELPVYDGERQTKTPTVQEGGELGMAIMRRRILLGLIGWSLLGACEPRVRVEPPEKPIVINLNIKIEHEIRVKVEKDVEDLLKKKPDLF